jgi:hypothetical protein
MQPAPTTTSFSPYESVLPASRMSGTAWTSINGSSTDTTTFFEDFAPPSKRQRIETYDGDEYQKTKDDLYEDDNAPQ